jgi:2,5-dihydroxypyridine 5,6-dioxygenase
MPLSSAHLSAVWREVLMLSNLRSDENVLILTSSNSNGQLLAAATDAVAGIGATVCRLHVEPLWDPREAGADPISVTGKSPIDNNPVAVTAMKRADMVIDLMHLLFTPAQREIIDSGTRMLLAYEPPEILARLVPTLDDRRRVLAAREAYSRGSTIHVTSDAGTDLRAKIGDSRITAEYGFVDEPGRWDHWPSGFVARVPNDRTAEGVVVISPGDIIIPFKSYVHTPIRLTIERGFITRIEGGADADFMKSYLDEYEEPNAYAVSHLGWGLQPRARWTSLGLYDKQPTIGMEARAYYGNFLFATGPGPNVKAHCHLDIPMRHCSFFIDEQPMTLKGDVMPEDQRVDSARRIAA